MGKLLRKTNLLLSIFDVEEGYSLTQAIAEADRCLLCYDAPCSEGCPAETDPGTFIRKLRLKNLKGAVRTIKKNNILGGVCGIVCPTGRLCEEKCSSTEIDRAINIGKLQRFLIEYGWQVGFNPLIKKSVKNIRVAVIGSGPAGLTCAAELAKEGYSVTVFESNKKPGGILRYGVPSFRLGEGFIDRELKDITALGVQIKCNFSVKGKGAIENLLKKGGGGFKAVFVAAGLSSPYKLNIPGAHLKNVTTSTELLKDVRAGNQKKISKMVKNKNVAIIGGGSVAMDVANTCKVLKAKKVYCIALESMQEIPADKDDLQMAIDNYVIIKPQCRIKEITGKDGAVSGVKGNETEWKVPGLLIPSNAKDVPGTEFSLKVGAVIIAIGSGPSPQLKEQLPNVQFTKRGLIQVNKKTLATSVKGVYAGGDIVRGPALVVDSIADGKTAAKSIIKVLTGFTG
ncbi:MAG: FAD-dependent oxidoreductase [Elusimicrobiota bacterium]|nr:FAD-dependent oxidoreductase [Elusimicrobiota bacterium]